MDPPRRHNPNYPPPTFASYGAPSSQHPTAQQPPFDPFKTRDPFMPSREQPQPPPPPAAPFWHGEPQAPRPLDPRRDVLQPAPGPPPSPFSAGPTLFEADHMRRRSLGGSLHQTSPLEPMHPQQGFSNRQMPPPSATSPQPLSAPVHGHQPLSRNHLPTPPPGSVPTLGPPNVPQRHGNMSISSIMGSESAASHRPDPGWPLASGRGPSSSGPPYHAPSSPPRSAHPFARQADLDAHPRPYTPAGRIIDTQMTGSQFGHQMPNGSPRQSHPAHLPPRPYSQPIATEPRDLREPSRHAFGPPGRPHEAAALVRSRAGSDLTRDGPSSVSANREVPSAPAFGPHQDRPGPFTRPAWGSPVKQEEPRYGPVEYGPPPRAAVETPHYMPPHPAGPVHGPPPRPEPYANGQSREYHQFGPDPRRPEAIPMQSSLSNDSYSGRSISLDAHLRRSLEDSQMAHKSILGGLHQDHRKIDRGSPLPQAVHGVSAQPHGIARDPHVKSEFGRMFAGLGSGVGSTPQPVQHPLPRPHSPLEEGDERRRSSLYDYDGFRRRGRAKRPYDDDRMDSGDSADGRASPMPMHKGPKKPRHMHHHHHHLPHHHHFSHRRDDDAVHAGLRRLSESPAMQRNPSTNSLPGAAHHHHHHHHHLGHHHHHAVRQQQGPPTVPLRRPTIEVRTSPLVQSVANKPRNHLGSQLYAPKIKSPSSFNTPMESRPAFALASDPIPRFDDKENCTYTIRVPRYYLTSTAREQITFQRRIWGTDVYTDDSDPLCAAIHGGWIRGSWNADVDEELLELDHPPAPSAEPSDAKAETSPSSSILKSPPATGPRAPPADVDMHITLLILPALEKYTSSTWHGVRSRGWGGDHDGMSFKILQVEFKDEGLGLLGLDAGHTGDKLRQKRFAGPTAVKCGLGLPIVGGMKKIKGGRVSRVGA